MLPCSMSLRDRVHCAPLFSIDGSTDSRRPAIGPERPIPESRPYWQSIAACDARAPVQLTSPGPRLAGVHHWMRSAAEVGASLGDLENSCWLSLQTSLSCRSCARRHCSSLRRRSRTSDVLDWRLATRCCGGCDRASRDAAPAITRRLRSCAADSQGTLSFRRSPVVAPDREDWRRNLRNSAWGRWFVRAT